VEVNQGEAFYIILRQLSDIYNDVSLPDELIDEYSYKNGVQLSLEEIIEMEVERAVVKILALQHDPFAFDQVNVRSFEKDGRVVSLLQLWMEGVLDRLATLSSLPIQTVKQDYLAENYRNRMRMDQCSPVVTLQVLNGQIVSVTAISEQDCQVALSGLDLHDLVPVERVGEEITSFITLKAEVPQTFVLPSPTPFDF